MHSQGLCRFWHRREAMRSVVLTTFDSHAHDVFHVAKTEFSVSWVFSLCKRKKLGSRYLSFWSTLGWRWGKQLFAAIHPLDTYLCFFCPFRDLSFCCFSKQDFDGLPDINWDLKEFEESVPGKQEKKKKSLPNNQFQNKFTEKKVEYVIWI